MNDDNLSKRWFEYRSGFDDTLFGNNAFALWAFYSCLHSPLIRMLN